MAAYPECEVRKQKVYRVVDDCTPVLSTLDPAKALAKLQEVLDKHDVSYGWVETDELE